MRDTPIITCKPRPALVWYPPRHARLLRFGLMAAELASVASICALVVYWLVRLTV